MLIHGFADDNVTIAHGLRLSQALMAAGRPHTFLPLTGITHMTNDPVAENLLTLQRDFLRDALDPDLVARFGAEWNGIPPQTRQMRHQWRLGTVCPISRST